MALRPLPPDYAPGDRPTAAELNGLKDYAGNQVDRLTTVLRRTTLVQSIAYATFVAVSWQSVFGGYNGMGWAVGTPTRIPCPAGGSGRYQVTFTGQFAAAAGGFRYCGLYKNGTLAQPGQFAPSDGTLTAWLCATWEVQMVPGDYLEVVVYQNRTGSTALNLDVLGDSPQVSVRRVEK